MTEKELRPSPEREVKPISIELTTTRDQEAMLAIADRSLYSGTLEEIRSSGVGGVKVENSMWRPIFRKLVSSLGKTYGPKELLMRGIIDDIPLQTLEQWAKGKSQLSLGEKDAMQWRARYFLKQKRQAMKKGLK